MLSKEKARNAKTQILNFLNMINLIATGERTMDELIQAYTLLQMQMTINYEQSIAESEGFDNQTSDVNSDEIDIYTNDKIKSIKPSHLF